MPATIDPTERQFDESKAPRSAFRVELGQFKAGDNDDGKTPFEMLARSKEPVMHWYWGAIYHDFDGMQVADSIPVDYCHDDNEIMGYADKFNVGGDGLIIKGALVHHHEGDRVDDVTHKAKNGVPYQSSIDFRGDDILAEQVNEGFTAQVNGETIEGPALIFRQWPLIGMAVCPHGRDKNTSTQFSEDDAESCVFRIFSEGTMPKKTLTGKPAKNKPAQQQTETPTDDDNGGSQEVDEQQTETSEGEPKPDAQQSEVEIDNPETVEQFNQKLKAFVAMFGAENGLKWFDEGLSYSQAHKRNSEEMQKQLAKEQEKNSQLSEKLDALKTGEDVPAQQSESDETDAAGSKDDGKFSFLGGGLSKFAASMSEPKKS